MTASSLSPRALLGLLLTLVACGSSGPHSTTSWRGLGARPILGAPVAEPAGEAELSFLVGGHLSGDPFLVNDGPSPTLVAALPELTRPSDRFFVSCGDLFRDYDQARAKATASVLSKLGLPVYNAPGNHDWNQAYREDFGAGYGSFRAGPALMVLLNSELDPWQISGAQLDFLRETVALARAEPEIEQVFFFAHKLLFAAESERYALLFDHANAHDSYPGHGNFASEIRPLLAELAASRAVYWFGGDVGVRWSLSLFWDRDPETDVTFAAVGSGSTRRDCLLRVHLLTGRREARVDVVSLSAGAAVELGEPVTGPVGEHGLARWRAAFPD